MNSLENIESETTGQKPTKKKYYKDNPEAVRNRDARRMYVNGKEVSKFHPLHKPGRYKSWEAVHSHELLESVKEGYVYIITNPAWPEWIKVGMAVDADDRCNGYQTSSPFRDYEIVYSFKTDDRRKSERDAHTLIERYAEERRGEWFKITPGTASHLLSTIH